MRECQQKQKYGEDLTGMTHYNHESNLELPAMKLRPNRVSCEEFCRLEHRKVHTKKLAFPERNVNW